MPARNPPLTSATLQAAKRKVLDLDLLTIDLGSIGRDGPHGRLGCLSNSYSNPIGVVAWMRGVEALAG